MSFATLKMPQMTDKGYRFFEQGLAGRPWYDFLVLDELITLR